MPTPAAARIGDQITHSKAMEEAQEGALKGALWGALIGVAVVALTIATAGTGLIAVVAVTSAVVGAVGTEMVMTGGGFLAGAAAGQKHTVAVGVIMTASTNVFINKRAAAASCLSVAACSQHSPTTQVASGSSTVTINQHMAARVGDLGVCSFAISSGSANVFIGGKEGACAKITGEIPEDMFERAENLIKWGDRLNKISMVLGVAALLAEIPRLFAQNMARLAANDASQLSMTQMRNLALARAAARQGFAFARGAGLSYGGGAAMGWVGGKVFGEGSVNQMIAEQVGANAAPFADGHLMQAAGRARVLAEGANPFNSRIAAEAVGREGGPEFGELSPGAKRLVRGMEGGGSINMEAGTHTAGELAEASNYYGKEVGVAQHTQSGDMRATLGREDRVSREDGVSGLGDNERWVAHTHTTDTPGMGDHDYDVAAKQRATERGDVGEGGRVEATVDLNGDLAHFNDQGVLHPDDVTGSPFDKNGYLVGQDRFAPISQDTANDSDRFMVRPGNPPPLDRTAIDESNRNAPDSETSKQANERLRPLRAERYADLVNSDTDWRWNNDFDAHVPVSEQSRIRQAAIDQGLITNVPVTEYTTTSGETRRYADFSGVVRRDQDGNAIEFQLPQTWTDPDTGVHYADMWHAPDPVQFKYSNQYVRDNFNSPGYSEAGSTWHHNEGQQAGKLAPDAAGNDARDFSSDKADGTMQLIPYGIHRINQHEGGVKANNWGHKTR